MIKKRKILFPIMSRVHYARQKLLLDLLAKNPNIELQIVIGGSAMLDKYGQTAQFLEKEGFDVKERIFSLVEGGNNVSMTKTTGLLLLEFSNILQRLNPDIVLVRGDRYEQLGIAMASVYLNKLVAHIEGGDVSGTIDESVRHAITKLAHLHFVTNDQAHARLIKMGEDNKSVFNVGSPDVEYAASITKDIDEEVVKNIGVAASIDLKKPFLMVMYHPVATEKDNWEKTETLLKAVSSLGMQVLWFWPNADAGTNDVSGAIRRFRENNPEADQHFRFMINMPSEDFIQLLKKTACLIGNSSAGIKECSYLGIPVVNVGTRQQCRLRAGNVKDVDNDINDIIVAIREQINHGHYEPSHLYYKPDTSQRISDILGNAEISVQKRFID